jgi:hypothetical protein
MRATGALLALALAITGASTTPISRRANLPILMGNDDGCEQNFVLPTPI